MLAKERYHYRIFHKDSCDRKESLEWEGPSSIKPTCLLTKEAFKGGPLWEVYECRTLEAPYLATICKSLGTIPERKKRCHRNRQKKKKSQRRTQLGITHRPEGLHRDVCQEGKKARALEYKKKKEKKGR